jgi:2'-5' RNA ligase
MKRTFIAIKIPLTKNISEIYQHIKIGLKEEKIKWVEEFNLHITILFLGDTNEKDIEKICKNLSLKLNEFSSFLLNVFGVGVFKSVYNPKAIWIGTEESEKIKELYELIVNTLTTVGIEVQKRDFKPHITIGRTKNLKDKFNLKKLIERNKEKVIDHIKITEVFYYESLLTPNGPVYNEIKKFNLI